MTEKTNKRELCGREFDLPVSFICDSDEEILDSQREARDAFLASWDAVEKSKDAIERYCLDRDGDQIGDSITNIFKYVIPTDIFVLRNTDVHEVALMCNYRYDPEHGLATVFENERLKKIIPQDEL